MLRSSAQPTGAAYILSSTNRLFRCIILSVSEGIFYVYIYLHIHIYIYIYIYIYIERERERERVIPQIIITVICLISVVCSLVLALCQCIKSSILCYSHLFLFMKILPRNWWFHGLIGFASHLRTHRLLQTYNN